MNTSLTTGRTSYTSPENNEPHSTHVTDATDLTDVTHLTDATHPSYPPPSPELIADIRKRLDEIPKEALERFHDMLAHESIDNAGRFLYRAGVCLCSRELYEYRKTLFPPNALLDAMTADAPVLRNPPEVGRGVEGRMPMPEPLPERSADSLSVSAPATDNEPLITGRTSYTSPHTADHRSLITDQGQPITDHASLSTINPQPSTINTPAAALLNDLRSVLSRYLVLPEMAAEALALWVVHTYAFTLRQVTTYIGVVSPEKRCGKTTLLELLGRLANRSLTAANISPSAMFRVIEQTQPTLLIDEADTFLEGRDELAGILNAGYRKGNAYVLRVASPTGRRTGGTSYTSPHITDHGLPITDPSSSSSTDHGSLITDQGQLITDHNPSTAQLARFSTWCPKVMAAIGRLPDTLADRCIVITMQRKRPDEECERLRELDGLDLRQRCARFVREHSDTIAQAHPKIPSTLNDRAADIWEPLFVLADLAGGDWPGLARQAAITLSGSAQETASPAGLLFNDIRVVFEACGDDRIFSRELVGVMNGLGERPWRELRRGKPITEMWLAMQLRPYGIRPKTTWIGAESAKGYERADFDDAFRRYLPAAPLKYEISNVKSPNADPSLKYEISNVESPSATAASLKYEISNVKSPSADPSLKCEISNVKSSPDLRPQAQFALLMEKLLAAASKPAAEENGSYEI